MNGSLRRMMLILAGSATCLAGCSQMPGPVTGVAGPSHMRGGPAPELAVDEWMNTPDERPVRLGERRGSPVLVEFWATW